MRPAASAARRRMLRSGLRRARSSSPCPRVRASSRARTRARVSMRGGGGGGRGLAATAGRAGPSPAERSSARRIPHREQLDMRRGLYQPASGPQATATRSSAGKPEAGRFGTDPRAGPGLSDRGQVERALRSGRALDPEDRGAVDPLPDLRGVDLDEGGHRGGRGPGARGPSACRSCPRPRSRAGARLGDGAAPEDSIFRARNRAAA